MPTRQVLTFPATPAGLQQAADDIRRTLDDSDLPPRSRYSIELVFDEIVTNIIRHGRSGPADIEARFEVGANEAVLTFEDDGEPFDPCQQPDPTLPTTLDDAKIGGLGLMLVRKAAGRIEYKSARQSSATV